MYFTQFDDCLAYLNSQEYDEKTVVLIFVAEKSSDTLPTFLDDLRAQHIPFVAGLFPSVIIDGEVKNQGLTVTIVPTLHAPIRLDIPLSDTITPDFDNLIASAKQLDYKPLLMMITTNSYDTLSKLGDSAAYVDKHLGNHFSYMGGGAGSVSLSNVDCVFDNAGSYQRTVILIPIKVRNNIGTSFGWTPIGKYHIVDAVDGIVIEQVAGKPAMQWFQQEYQKLTGKLLKREEIDFTLDIHIGLHTKLSGYIMRSILDTTDAGGLVVGASVPPNSLICLMGVHKNSVIGQTALMAKRVTRNVRAIQHTFIIECVTRPVVMGEKFVKELNTIEASLTQDRPYQTVGFVAMGEFGRVRHTSNLEHMNESIILAVTY